MYRHQLSVLPKERWFVSIVDTCRLPTVIDIDLPVKEIDTRRVPMVHIVDRNEDTIPVLVLLRFLRKTLRVHTNTWDKKHLL